MLPVKLFRLVFCVFRFNRNIENRHRNNRNKRFVSDSVNTSSGSSFGCFESKLVTKDSLVLRKRSGFVPIQTVILTSMRLDSFLYEATQNCKSFQKFKTKIKRSKTYSKRIVAKYEETGPGPRKSDRRQGNKEEWPGKRGEAIKGRGTRRGGNRRGEEEQQEAR
jgi:hypothetical protein